MKENNELTLEERTMFRVIDHFLKGVPYQKACLLAAEEFIDQKIGQALMKKHQKMTEELAKNGKID